MRILITGGAGFIGSNVSKICLDRKYHLTVLDNLSRRGTAGNLNWLRKNGDFEFLKMDIRDREKIVSCFKKSKPFDAVFHFAGQVAVTTSVLRPFEDFDVNALGTLNLLEAIRLSGQNPFLLFSSTNKVYGSLEEAPLAENKTRYSFKSLRKGIAEEYPLDFHSPYGCSKGAADQYVRDYARVYGLNAVVFRQSCIYGPRQFGVEDQGWVAWFMIAKELGKDVTIYGNGKQVRDLLHIDDLSDAFFKALAMKDKIKGEVFNIGGGHNNTLSVKELVLMLQKEKGNGRWKVARSDWRPGDQKIYISDIGKARKILKWTPGIETARGIAELRQWIRENRATLERFQK